MTTLVVCESVAAIVTHLREVVDDIPIKLGGHSFPRPRALCDALIAWDTRSPIASVGCGRCRAVAKHLRQSGVKFNNLPETF